MTWLRDRGVKRERDEALRSAEDSKELAARLTATFTGAGHPLVVSLGKLVAGEVPPEAGLVSLAERTLDSAKRRCGVEPGQNRACIYRLRDEDELVLDRWRGRHQEPRRSFARRDVPHGRSVLEFIHGNPAGVQRYPDLKEEAPAGFGDVTSRSYRTFVATPITLGGRVYGMLAVDSPTPRSLTATDEGMLILLAGMLAVGIAATERCGVPGADGSILKARSGTTWTAEQVPRSAPDSLDCESPGGGAA